MLQLSNPIPMLYQMKIPSNETISDKSFTEKDAEVLKIKNSQCAKAFSFVFFETGLKMVMTCIMTTSLSIG